MNASDDSAFEPVETMDLSGGDISLDFVNTASRRDPGPPLEKLRSYRDLVTWAERVGVVSEATGRQLRAAALEADDEAGAVLRRARDLREAIFRLFARSEGERGADLALVAEEAGRGAAARTLAAGPKGYTFAWPESDRLEQILWPVALSAAELLTTPDERERVKECAADSCNWLFLDMSRNRSRRWCDMKVCGNRAKARRFSERHRDD